MCNVKKLLKVFASSQQKLFHTRFVLEKKINEIKEDLGGSDGRLRRWGWWQLMWNFKRKRNYASFNFSIIIITAYKDSSSRDGNHVVHTATFVSSTISTSFLYAAFSTFCKDGLKRFKNYFMNFSCEIGFHAFLSFLFEMKRSNSFFLPIPPARDLTSKYIHFSFISLIESFSASREDLTIDERNWRRNLIYVHVSGEGEAMGVDWEEFSIHLHGRRLNWGRAETERRWVLWNHWNESVWCSLIKRYLMLLITEHCADEFHLFLLERSSGVNQHRSIARKRFMLRSPSTLNNTKNRIRYIFFYIINLWNSNMNVNVNLARCLWIQY